MKAMLLTEYKQLELTDMPEPDVAENSVLVRVRACGICGSDIHGYDGSTGRRIPPLVMGHEAAGIVERVGTSVTRFRPGMRVTFDSMISCGKCSFCQRGQFNLCDHRRVLGVSCGDYRQHGAFAELVAVPEHIVFEVPDDLSLEYAAMVEPVSVAVHAVNITPIKLGDTAVVVGAGMIGTLVIQALRRAGCPRVIAIDKDASRLKLSAELGADVTLHVGSVDVVEAVKQLTGGRGADVVLEVVGASETVKTAILCCRKGGTVTLVGNLAPHIELPLQSVVTREIRLQGSCASAGEYPACLALMARGDILVEPLITARIPLSDGPAWFSRLYKGEPGLMKVLVMPNGMS